jgi:hypothetical protein
MDMINSIYQKHCLSGRVNEASHGKAAFLLVNLRQNYNFVRFGVWLDKNFSHSVFFGFDKRSKGFSILS